jgi:ceramide glucosyltransferase
MTALLLYVGILVLKTWGAWVYIRRYPVPSERGQSASVTICQPILSGDPDLEAALTDNLNALPDVEFLWLIDELDLEASRITASLAQRYPGVAIRVLRSPNPPDGINPKLFKLEAAGQVVSPGILVVLDDDTRLGQMGLKALIGALAQAELATGLPYYRSAGNVFGNLLAQFVNNNAALTYLPLLNLAPPVSINGMCYAMKTDALGQLQGFSPLLRNLTDDLAVADSVRESGGRIIQTPFPQEVATTIESFKQYMAQMHRWFVFALLLMRRRGVFINASMVLFYALPPLLLWVGAVQALLCHCVATTSFLLATLMVRGLLLSGLQRHLTGRSRHRPALSIASELLQPVHLIHAILVRSIRWRTRHYRVYDNDRFVSI